MEKHPKIYVTRDLLHPVTSGDEVKTLFLPVEMPFLKQLAQIYYEQGLEEALQTATTYNHVLVSKSAVIVLNVLKYLNKFRIVFNSSKQESDISIINESSQTRNWYTSTIRYISWHPYMTKIAVVTCDDSVRIYSSDTTFTPILRSKQQKNISCAAWRPFSNTEIAVAHKNGIIIWNLDSSSLVARPSASNATILHRLEHTPVTSIAWSPTGDFLVSSAALDGTILVWDCELDRVSRLKRPGGTGNLLVKWSPSGEKLFTSTNTLVFRFEKFLNGFFRRIFNGICLCRVWDCRNWDCERWTILTGRIQTACWTNCGTNLLFATTTETVIYGVVIKSDKIFTTNMEDTSKQAHPLYDVSKVDIDGVMVGGLIHSMETDPKGKHLAVMYEDTNCITVFNIIKQTGVLQLCPSSLIIGLVDERPSCISFQNSFQQGACLTIGWSSGRIQYYPIIYSDLTATNCSNLSQNVQNITVFDNCLY